MRQYCITLTFGKVLIGSVFADSHEMIRNSTGEPSNGVGLKAEAVPGYVAVFDLRPGIELSYRAMGAAANDPWLPVEAPPTVSAATAIQSESCGTAQ